MRYMKFGVILLLFILSGCMNFQNSTTTQEITTTKQEINLETNTNYESLKFGDKRIINQEIKRNTTINTNIDNQAIDYLLIEYSVYDMLGDVVKTEMFSTESIENGIHLDDMNISIDDNHMILIETRQTLESVILTPIIVSE